MKKCLKIIITLLICMMFSIIYNQVYAFVCPDCGIDHYKTLTANNYKATYKIGQPKGYSCYNGEFNTNRIGDLLIGGNHGFCIQHGQTLTSGAIYRVYYRVNISGKKSIIYSLNKSLSEDEVVDAADEKYERTVNSDENAIFSYIVSQSDFGWGDDSESSEIQTNVWGYISTWLKANGLTTIASNANGAGSTSFESGAQNYLKSLTAADETLESKTNTSNLKKEYYTYSGNGYIKIGPFKNNFSSVFSYKSCTVYDQDSKAISVKYGKYNGTSFIVKDKIGDVSTSGSDFYILVPVSSNATKINKINFTYNYSVKNIVSDIWILRLEKNRYDQNTPDKNQNLMVTNSTTETVTNTKEIEVGEINLTGSLKIQKVNKDNATIKLAGVGFKIKNDRSGKYINKASNGTISYVEESKATEFVTDSNGEILVENLLVGDYTAYETKNPNYGYDLLTTGQNITVSVGTTTTKKITNKQTKIKLSGYVWEDLPYDEGKEEGRLELYKGSNKDINDKLLAGIKVTLKDDSGNVIKTTTTDSEGKYTIVDVLIEQLGNYHIEFEYNGMCYENITVTKDKNNGNKASEGTNRTTFNENYKTISYGKSNKYNLTYSTENYQSNLLYRSDGNTSKYVYGYTGNTRPVSGVDSQYMITASTKNSGYELDEIKSKDDILKENIIELGNINLGIKKRNEVDLSLIKDVYSAKVSINGQEHVYNYADRFNTNTDGQYYSMDPKVKFGQEYGSMSYTRALYASDIYYEGDNELKVEVTYKIGIKNSSSSLKAVVNELTDYYDEKYENIKVGTEINTDGTVKQDTTNFNVSEDGKVGTYTKVKIECKNEKLTVANEEQCVYVQLEVKKDEIVKILGSDDNIVKLDNITEISSYSIKDGNGAAYAAIDIDSQPGNCIPGDTTTYEDDNDKAPGLKVILQEERKISGQVFVDKTTGELKTGEVRQGDGVYKEEDEKLPGVGVKLINAETGETAKKCVVTKGSDGKYTIEWEDAETTTDENGEYMISGVIPDNYQVVYTWGNQTYKVQDYKATVVNENVFTAKNSDLEWYKDEFKVNYSGIEWNAEENNEIRTSDAIDNYDTRLAIDKQTNVITNGVKETLEDYSSTSKITVGTEEQDLITTMDSTTPTFIINLEYNITSTNVAEEYKLDSNGEIVLNDIYAVKAEGKENHIRSIDFGIVERARQVLELEKKIKSAKIVLSDGSVLINAQVQEDGTLKDDPKHVVYIPESEGSNGQLKFEIDSDIVQGARLEIEYGLTVTNKSELEYINEEFYHYGEGQIRSQLVTLNATNVIDYLDNNIATDMSKNASWTVMQDNEARIKLIDEQKLLENTEEMKSLLEGTSKIVLTDELSEKLQPLDSKTIGLIGYKLLSVNDETILENNAEIIQVEKTGGSTLITKPGNYIPNVSASEMDDDKSEIVSVIPPTGLEINDIAYIILAISSLGILVAGIILIKKLVLRK